MNESPPAAAVLIHTDGPFKVKKVANAAEVLNPGSVYERLTEYKLGEHGKDLLLCVQDVDTKECFAFIIDWPVPHKRFRIRTNGQWDVAARFKGVPMPDQKAAAAEPEAAEQAPVAPPIGE
jgi:hypothetical protein